MSNENDGGWGSFDWMSGAESGGGSAPAFGWQGGPGGGWDDRQSRMDALFGGSDWNTDFFDFLDPVGPDQPNRREDVIKLESLLGNSGHYDVSRTDGPTGWWGTPLEDGLKDYQKEKGLEVDGLVLPKGPTLASLKGDLASKMGGFRAPSAAEVDRHHTNNRLGEGGLLVDRPPPLKFHPAPNLPELEDDAFAANRRSAANLAQIGDPGDFPNLAKLAVGDYGEQAIAELRDLVGRIGEINPTIADAYGRAIKNALEPEQRAAFLGGPERPDPPLGVLKTEAEARLGSFPSLDDARRALAEQIGGGEGYPDEDDTPTPETVAEANGRHTDDTGPIGDAGADEALLTLDDADGENDADGEDGNPAPLRMAAQRGDKPSQVPAKPGDDSPIHPEFREKLHRHESEGKPNQGYEAKNGDALGRYQMTPPALKDAGYMDAKGKWTGKDGIKSEQDFLKNPSIQEKALTEFMTKVEGYVRTSSLNSKEGKEIDGIRNKFEVTENGIMAAAHRRGASATDAYFQHQERNGWKSQFEKIDPELARKADPKHDGHQAKQVFMSIETRLRQFADVPYRR
ncbi:MAG: peptidoglycan-binding protein [Rhodospirillales bacterium]|nr:peptidoglycan-binding protein [Rhodospirillales bacterium]